MLYWVHMRMYEARLNIINARTIPNIGVAQGHYPVKQNQKEKTWNMKCKLRF